MKENSYYLKHMATLNRALQACYHRDQWSPFQESPSARFHKFGALEAGKLEFEEHLQRPFRLHEMPCDNQRTGEEVSPYTREFLGVDYPKLNISKAIEAAKAAMPDWISAGHRERAGICLEMAFELEKHCFANAFATMHTAGQSFLMAYSGSGPNALDRGVEAIAYGFSAQNQIKPDGLWSKAFGRSGSVTLQKSYELRPVGIAAVICCATFPLWNAYPAMFANLVTGNPVILKPHPNGILPVAMALKTCRKVLKEAGFDPNLIMMAADTRCDPVTIELLHHSDIKIIDYTGSQKFGNWIEENFPKKLIFTETAGCNAVVIHSTSNLKDMISALANGLCGFSAQMCTSPQNIHVPAKGINTDEGPISFKQFKERLIEAIEERVSDPKKAAGLCGALQADESLYVLQRLRIAVAQLNSDKASIVRDAGTYAHPEFPKARTATPMVIEVESAQAQLYREEHFAPVAFLIREENADRALDFAAYIAQTYGAISSYLYSANEAFTDKAKRAFADAGASLWVNMPAAMPMNFAAAYSDYHVTGLNPAGNACLTDLAFVASRFRIVQFREPVDFPEPAPPV